MSDDQIALVAIALLAAAGSAYLIKRTIDGCKRWWRRQVRQWRKIKAVVLFVTSPLRLLFQLGGWIQTKVEPPPDEEIERATISSGLRQYLMRRDDCTCQVIDDDTGEVCGHYMSEDNPVEIHHWLPFKPFPWLDRCRWNLVCACWKCNNRLSDTVPKYARDWERGGEIICLASEMAKRRGHPKKWLQAASF